MHLNTENACVNMIKWILYLCYNYFYLEGDRRKLSVDQSIGKWLLINRLLIVSDGCFQKYKLQKFSKEFSVSPPPPPTRGSQRFSNNCDTRSQRTGALWCNTCRYLLSSSVISFRPSLVYLAQYFQGSIFLIGGTHIPLSSSFCF